MKWPVVTRVLQQTNDFINLGMVIYQIDQNGVLYHSGWDSCNYAPVPGSTDYGSVENAKEVVDWLIKGRVSSGQFTEIFTSDLTTDD